MDVSVRISRLSHKAYCNKFLRWGGVNVVLKLFNRVFFSCDIAFQIDLPASTKLPHQGLGVVMHPNTILGDNCTIFQNVTLGANGKNGGLAPQIGNEVMIGAGAVIMGDVKVGDHAIIGANSVVLHDVPKNAVVAGIPAKLKYVIEDL